MWPLRSRRSSTFSISKLGYLASRAPKAMFSRSRKTAMVASEVVAVIGARVYSIRRPAGATPLEPIEIETDADAFGVDAVRHHFMPQPTFKEQQLSRRRRKRSPWASLARRSRLARRRGQEAGPARDA